MNDLSKVKICSVKRHKSNFVVYLVISFPGGGGSGFVSINYKAVEVMMKHFNTENRKGLKGKIFETPERFYLEKALRGFFKQNYPKEKNILVKKFEQKPPKYNPDVWTIVKVFPEAKYLVIGHEVAYVCIRVEGHPKGCSLPFQSGPAYLTPKSLGLLMSYFGVKKPESLIGKNFRANVDDSEAAVLALILNLGAPELI